MTHPLSCGAAAGTRASTRRRRRAGQTRCAQTAPRLQKTPRQWTSETRPGQRGSWPRPGAAGRGARGARAAALLSPLRAAGQSGARSASRPCGGGWGGWEVGSLFEEVHFLCGSLGDAAAGGRLLSARPRRRRTPAPRARARAHHLCERPASAHARCALRSVTRSPSATAKRAMAASRARRSPPCAWPHTAGTDSRPGAWARGRGGSELGCAGVCQERRQANTPSTRAAVTTQRAAGGARTRRQQEAVTPAGKHTGRSPPKHHTPQSVAHPPPAAGGLRR